MQENVAHYFHVSECRLNVEDVLVSRFPGDEFQYQYDAVEAALQGRVEALQQLLQGRPELSLPLKEIIFEQVRSSEFASLRSRLNASVFLCPTRNDIMRYAQSYDTRPFLYLCEVEDAGLFRGDVLLVSGSDPSRPIEEQLYNLRQRARRYWQGERTPHPIIEILAPSGRVRVIAIESR